MLLAKCTSWTQKGLCNNANLMYLCIYVHAYKHIHVRVIILVIVAIVLVPEKQLKIDRVVTTSMIRINIHGHTAAKLNPQSQGLQRNVCGLFLKQFAM